MQKEKEQEGSRNNSEPCSICKQKDSQFWNKGYCNLVPEFEINTNGELENLACSFIFWIISNGYPKPTGEELHTVNGYAIIPKQMKEVISQTNQDGRINLVIRYMKYLENVRDRILADS